MSRIVVSELVTLDGVMEAPGGEPGHPHTGWAGDFMDEEVVRSKHEEAEAAGALLLGRVTYESFAGAWSGYLGPFADRMNAMPKYVVSSTMREAGWNNTTVIAEDVFGAVARLKEAEGGPLLVCGSRTLVHGLLERRLVDEIRMTVIPVTVGSGFRPYPDSAEKRTMRLGDTRVFRNGVMALTYRLGAEMETRGILPLETVSRGGGDAIQDLDRDGHLEFRRDIAPGGAVRVVAGVGFEAEAEIEVDGGDTGGVGLEPGAGVTAGADNVAGGAEHRYGEATALRGGEDRDPVDLAGAGPRGHRGVPGGDRPDLGARRIDEEHDAGREMGGVSGHRTGECLGGGDEDAFGGGLDADPRGDVAILVEAHPVPGREGYARSLGEITVQHGDVMSHRRRLRRLFGLGSLGRCPAHASGGW